MTPALVERDRKNRFCTIHRNVKVERTKITDAEGNVHYVLRCPVCGVCDKT